MSFSAARVGYISSTEITLCNFEASLRAHTSFIVGQTGEMPKAYDGALPNRQSGVAFSQRVIPRLNIDTFLCTESMALRRERPTAILVAQVSLKYASDGICHHGRCLWWNSGVDVCHPFRVSCENIAWKWVRVGIHRCSSSIRRSVATLSRGKLVCVYFVESARWLYGRDVTVASVECVDGSLIMLLLPRVAVQVVESIVSTAW